MGIWHFNFNGNDCQQWKLNKTSDGEYRLLAKSSGKSLDVAGCSANAGSNVWIWSSYEADCQKWWLEPAPDAGATVAWRDFTVDTQAPGAPFVSSSDYPSDDGWHKAANQAGAFTFTPPTGVTDVAGYVYGLDVTPATEVAAGADGKATPSITPTTDGQHLLNVRTKDKAGNLSAIVTYKFNVGRAGLVRPSDGSRVVSRIPLQVQGESAFTPVKFAWRRGPGAAVEADIPAANLAKNDHIKGTAENINRKKTLGKGKTISTFFFGGRWANAHTRVANLFGRAKKGQPHIRKMTFPWPVGRSSTGALQRTVRVSTGKRGMHGSPWVK